MSGSCSDCGKPLAYGTLYKAATRAPISGRCFPCWRAFIQAQARSPEAVLARLTAKRLIEDRGHSSPCWLWTGSLNQQGYGQISIASKNWRVHRLAYEYLAEAIPAGMCIDHLCRVKVCFNPDHLEVVTFEENTRRARAHEQEAAQ